MLNEIKAKIEQAFSGLEEFENSEGQDFKEAYYYLKNVLKEIQELTELRTISFIFNQ